MRVKFEEIKRNLKKILDILERFQPFLFFFLFFQSSLLYLGSKGPHLNGNSMKNA